MEKTTVGERIKALRKRNGLKLKDLAKSLNCSVSYLSELENNKKTASGSFVFHLSHILCSSSEYILAGKEPHDSTYDELYEIILSHGEITHARLFHEILFSLLAFHSQKIEYSDIVLKELIEKNKNNPTPATEKSIELIKEVMAKSQKTMSAIGPIIKKGLF
jgi:transcriptional regulator with XRE-family HTH domain